MSKNKKVLIVIGAAVLIVAVSLISSAITKRHEKAKQAEQMTELFGDDNPFEEADDQEQDDTEADDEKEYIDSHPDACFLSDSSLRLRKQNYGH